MRNSRAVSRCVIDSRLAMPVRIGAVSYLNTKPLIFGLRERLPGCELILDLPSRLADQLIEGKLDIALIPSIAYFKGGDELAIVSDACIACRGPVRSVQLLLRRPPTMIKTLALDEGSRTSAVLARVLLSQLWNVHPTLIPLPIDMDYEGHHADAILVIGDRAMNVDRSRYQECWDLGELWNRWSELPFVFAMWIARKSDCHRPEIQQAAIALQASRDAGLANVGRIAEEQSGNYNLTIDDCVTYFTQQLHFVLGTQEIAGLELFRSYADRLDARGAKESFPSSPNLVRRVPLSTD